VPDRKKPVGGILDIMGKYSRRYGLFRKRSATVEGVKYRRSYYLDEEKKIKPNLLKMIG